MWCTDADLELRRHGITEMMPDGTALIRSQADSDVAEDLDRLWYRRAATERGIDWRETPLDTDEMTASEVKRLAVLRTLTLIHEHLMQVGKDPTGYERLRDMYAKEYSVVLLQACDAGFSYDWDASGTVDDDERHISRPAPRLVRG